jgi:CRISPR-associated protein Cmr5
MTLVSLSQLRAKHAWDAVQEAKVRTAAQCREELKGKGRVSSAEDLENAERELFEKKFADPAKKMPARIRASGLGQTVAFMRAKEGGEVLKVVTDWCHRTGIITQATEDALMIQFKDGDAAQLRQLTGEALAYLEWLVRFADAARKDGR